MQQNNDPDFLGATTDLGQSDLTLRRVRDPTQSGDLSREDK